MSQIEEQINALLLSLALLQGKPVALMKVFDVLYEYRKANPLEKP